MTGFRDQAPETEAPPNDSAILPDVSKLEAMAEFAAGAGHEINNPLATITGRVQMLLRGETDHDRRQMLETIGGQAYRIRDMIGDAMLFGRPPKPQPEQVDLSTIVESVLEAYAERVQSMKCHLDLQLMDGLSLWADPVQLKVVISNLLDNSLNAISNGGIIAVSSNTAELPGGQSATRFVISDNGGGLSEIDRVHLFDPFYSGRQAGRGLGFGLPKCWRIITLHGGQIFAAINADFDESLLMGGVSFVINWPANASINEQPPTS